MGISFNAETCKNRDLGPERFAEAVPLTCANGYNPPPGVGDCPSHGLPFQLAARTNSYRDLVSHSDANAASGTSINPVIALWHDGHFLTASAEVVVDVRLAPKNAKAQVWPGGLRLAERP